MQTRSGGFDSYCGCCGERWYSGFYTEDACDTVAGATQYDRYDEHSQGFVHYADGRIVPVSEAIQTEEHSDCDHHCDQCGTVARMNRMLSA